MTRSRIQSIATEKVLAEINQSGFQDLIDAYVEQTQVGLQMKNVCVKLPLDLVGSMENLCEFLNINKRQFIQAAIFDAISQIERVIDAEGLHDFVRELDQEAAA